MLDVLSPSFTQIYRQDVELADDSLLDPTESDCLLQGEWLVMNSSETWERPTTTSVSTASIIFTEKGDFGAQALGKTTVLRHQAMEIETDMFVSDTYTIGQELTVKLGTVDGDSRGALEAATSGDYVHGHVTGLAANHDSKLRVRILAAPYLKD